MKDKRVVTHKANFKQTIEYYAGFGHYGAVTKPYCMGKLREYCPSVVANYKQVIQWSKVNCKKCLSKREKDELNKKTKK